MSEIKLAEFFQKRKEQEAQLHKDLQTKAKQLHDLIPEAVKGYAKEALSNMEQWLLDLYSNTIAGSCNNDKCKNLSDYSFKSKKEAKSVMRLLKDAWKGEIDIKISDYNYITVEFRMIGIVK